MLKKWSYDLKKMSRDAKKITPRACSITAANEMDLQVKVHHNQRVEKLFFSAYCKTWSGVEWSGVEWSGVDL